jgi:invasion protein IalB
MLIIISIFLLPLRVTWAERAVEMADGTEKREGDWIVSKQLPAGCMMQQDDASDSSKMSLVFGPAGIPMIVAPFFRGIEGDLRYQVDSREPGSVPAWAIKIPAPIELPRELVPALKAGRQLIISVTPVGDVPRVQRFSLIGFAAASRWLERETCQFKDTEAATGEGGSTSLDVALQRLSDGGLQVTGSTNLPDGMELTIDVRRQRSTYFAQDSVVVYGGKFSSSSFRNHGSSLPPGDYAISISSAIPDLLSESVRSVIGQNGENLKGPAVIEDFGARRIDWSVNRKLH